MTVLKTPVSEIVFTTKAHTANNWISVPADIKAILGFPNGEDSNIDKYKLCVTVYSEKGVLTLITQTRSGGEIVDFKDHIKPTEQIVVRIIKLSES